MTFAAFWTRASLRRSWRTLAGITLLFGLIGGLSLFSIAGARRTQSAYPRFLRSTNPSTMAVDVGGLDPDGYKALDVIAHLPQVVQARAYAGFYVAPWVDGQPDFSANFEAVGSLDGRYFDQDRFTPISGRLPDPSRADEVAVNEESARRYGYHVGQQIDFATVSRSDVEDAPSPDAQQAFQPRLLIHSTIVGVGAFIEEVVQDDTDRSPLVLFTPAYVKEAKGLELYAWQGLVLRNGDSDVATVKQTITELSGAGPQIFRVTSTDTFHAEQAMRPVALALATFGIIVGLACLVLVGQALGRHVRSERNEHAIARSLGAGPLHVALVTAIGPALAVVGGVVLAVVGAVAASPAMPVGQVRRVELSSGISADWTVLALGAAVSIVALFAVIGVVAWREAPQRVQQRAAHTRRVGRIAALASANLPPTAATGLRFSLVPGQGSAAVPVRSVMAGAAIAVAALIAAVTFGASMQHLVSNPRLFGWNWDVALVDGAGYGNSNPLTTDTVLASDANIEAWGGAFYGAEDINGLNVPLLGMNPSSSLTPPIREGRMVERSGEIVLGTATLARLRVDVGDTVNASTGPVLVVGSATFPTIGLVHGDHTSLGVGGIVVPEGVPGYDRNRVGSDLASGAQATPADEYGPNVLFVRFRKGTNKQAAIERLNGEVDQISDYNGIAVTPVQRSAEIVNANDISGSSALLGGAVALSALASLMLALTAAVRRRRRDLALLKALGFTRRQVSATIAWQATSTIAVGLLIGVPVGIVSGRLMWTLFAHQLDVVAEPAVPIIAIALVVLAALVAANALAVLPARYARAVPAALVLRGE
jgi:MacB-like periplasmic core domain/FtsX-like permease family